MNKATFDSLALRIAAYHQKRKPNDETLELWVDEFQNLPDQAAEWMFDWIKNHADDAMKASIPQLIWRAWAAWRQEHPHLLAAKAMLYECRMCQDGWLELMRFTDEYECGYVTAVIPCGHCNQIRSNVGAWTMQDAQAKGWQKYDSKQAFELCKKVPAKFVPTMAPCESDEWQIKL